MTRHRMIPVMTFGPVVPTRRCRHRDCDASCSEQMLQWFEARWVPGRVKKMLEENNAARDRDSMSMPSAPRRQVQKSAVRID